MAKQAMAVPPSVHDWIATPAPLNTEKHGGRAIFSGDNSVLERWRPNDNSGDCVCYTAHSLPVGQVWQTTVLNTSSEWRLGLVSGCVHRYYIYDVYNLFPVMPEGIHCQSLHFKRQLLNS